MSCIGHFFNYVFSLVDDPFYHRLWDSSYMKIQLKNRTIYTSLHFICEHAYKVMNANRNNFLLEIPRNYPNNFPKFAASLKAKRKKKEKEKAFIETIL